MGDKHNIIISSKNENNPSKVNVTLDNDLLCNNNEYWTVSVCSFNMIKSFYAVQNNLNNEFNILLKNKTTGIFDEPYFRSISQGNYTVRSLIKELKSKTFDLLDVSYDDKLNKFLFKRLDVVFDGDIDINDYDVYIEAVNSSVFLGIPNNERLLITEEGVHSPNFINVSGYTTMMMKLSGGISIENSLSNITNSHFEVNKTLAIIDLQQIRPMDSIIYSHQNSENLVYKIYDKKINNFMIEIVDENNETFPQMSDYILNLCFEKRTKKNEMLDVVKSILTRLNDLIFYILFAFDKMNIAEPNFS